MKYKTLIAIEDSDLSEFMRILKSEDFDKNARFISGEHKMVNDTNSGIGIIHLIAMFDRAEFLIPALESGLDVNMKDYLGHTPICFAANNGSYLLFDAIIKANADPFVIDNDGVTLMHYAVIGGNSSIVERLLSLGLRADTPPNPVASPLHLAVALQRFDVLTAIIRSRININLRDKNGATPLHFAARDQWKEGIRLLLESGADTQIKDPNGRNYYQIIEFEDLRAEAAKRIPDGTHAVQIFTLFRQIVLFGLFLSVQIVPTFCWLGKQMGEGDYSGYSISIFSGLAVIFSFDWVLLPSFFVSLIPFLGQAFAVFASMSVWDYGLFEALLRLGLPVIGVFATLYFLEIITGVSKYNAED